MEESLDLPEGFVTPSYSGSQYKDFRFKKADDRLVLRGLPAMKSLARSREFGLFFPIHYGWNRRDPKDPTKTISTPFLCIEEKSYGQTTRRCPACDYIKERVERFKNVMTEIVAKADKHVDAALKSGKNKAQVEKARVNFIENESKKEKDAFDKWKSDHNLDKKFKIPVMNQNGEFGVFACPYGAKIQLLKLIDSLKTQSYPGRSEPIQPFGRKGVWFVFDRVGKASLTSDIVSVLRKTQSDGSEIKEFHTITDEELKQAMDVIPDLKELLERNRISEAKMIELIELDRLGGGKADPDEVSRVLGKGVSEDPEAAEASEEDSFAFGREPEETNGTEVAEAMKIVEEHSKEEVKQHTEAVKEAAKEQIKQPEPIKEAVKESVKQTEPIKQPEPAKQPEIAVELDDNSFDTLFGDDN